MKTLARIALAALVVCSATRASAQRPHSDDEPGRPEGAQLSVTNHNWLDARLYLDDDGQLVPLGFVMSQQTATFKLPNRALVGTGPVRVVARPIGGSQSYVSQNLQVNRGDVLLVTLQNQLGLSSTSVLPVID